MATMDMPTLMTVQEVAQLTGLAKQTLDNWRSTRRAGPPYVKLGGRVVRYERSAVIDWINRKTINPAPVATA